MKLVVLVLWKNTVGSLIGIALTLWIALGSILILTLLIFPIHEHGIFLYLLVSSLISFIRPFNFSFFSVTGWGIDLDYCDIEWCALETNRDHSVVFEIVL